MSAVAASGAEQYEAERRHDSPPHIGDGGPEQKRSQDDIIFVVSGKLRLFCAAAKV